MMRRFSYSLASSQGLAFFLCSTVILVCATKSILNAVRRTVTVHVRKKPIFCTDKNVCATVVCTFFLVSTVSAQPLDSLLREATLNHPLLRAADARAVSAEYRADAVSALPAPTLSLEFAQTPAGNFDILNRSLSNNLGLSQMLMFGEKRDAMRRAEQQTAQTERERKGEIAAKIRAMVRELYARLWRLDKQKELRGRTTIMLSNLLQSAESRIVAGKADMSEILLLRAELQAEQSKFHGIVFERRGVLARLSRFLGRSQTDGAISTSLDTAWNQSLERLLAKSYQAQRTLMEQNPTLRTMSSMERMTMAEHDAVQQERLPDVMVQGMIMRMPQGMILTMGSSELSSLVMPNGTLMPQSRTDWMYSLMTSITLPFAPWSSARIDAKQAELQALHSSLQAEREAMHREISGEIAEQEQLLLHAMETAKDLTRTIIPAYKQVLERYTASFQTNQSSINDVLRSAQMLAMKEEELVMAQEEQMMIVAKIRLLIGEE